MLEFIGPFAFLLKGGVGGGGMIGTSVGVGGSRIFSPPSIERGPKVQLLEFSAIELSAVSLEKRDVGVRGENDVGENGAGTGT